MVLFGCFCRQSLTGKKYKLRPCTWVMHHFSLHDGEGGFRSSYNFLTFVESEHCSYLANGKESCRAWSTQAFCKASQMPGSHKKYIVLSFTPLCFLTSLEIFEFLSERECSTGFQSTFACNQGYQALWSWWELYCWWNRSDPSNTHEVRAMKSVEKLWNWVLGCCQPVTPSNSGWSLQPWPPHLIHLYYPNKLFTLTKFCTQAGALSGCQLVILSTQTRA
jgi:hypothetical protein